MLRFLNFLLICSFFHSSLSGQCPEKWVLWKRLVYLKDSVSSIPDSVKFLELKSYLDKINQCPPIHDSVNSFLLLSLGSQYSYKKDFKQAINYTLQSLNMIRDHASSPQIDESQQVRLYHNLNIFYGATGQTVLQRRAIDSCISISLRLKKAYSYSVQHFSSKIEYLFNKGDYYHCLQLAYIGESLSRKLNYGYTTIGFFSTWEIIANIFLNRFTEATEKLDRAIAECLQEGDQTRLGTLYAQRAIVAEKSGTPEAAEKMAIEAFIHERKNGKYSNCASILNNLGYELFYTRLHQPDRALYYYRKAMPFANADDSLALLNNIANVQVQNKEFPGAARYFQDAFDKISPGADENFFLKNATIESLNNWNVAHVLTLVLDKAESYIRKYEMDHNALDLQTAIRIYKSADRLMDKINFLQIEVSSQLFWRADSRRLYDMAIEACYLSGNKKDAFYFFEKGRAVLLNNQLKEQETGDTYMGEIAVVKKKILDIENQLAVTKQDSKEYADHQSALFTGNEQLNRIYQHVKDRNPWFYQSLTDTSFIGLEAIQSRLLSSGQAQGILEFFTGVQAVFLLSVSRDTAQLVRIDKAKFDSSVDRYSQFLADPEKLNKDFTGFVRAARELYHLINNPVISAAERLIISPDGKYFPFESLITNTQATSPEYFIQKHAVSYTYSVRFLLNDFTQRETSSYGNFLGVAPIHYPASFQLASLFQSDISLEKISSYFTHTRNIISSQASRSNFLEHFSDYKIIQLYTHASDSSERGDPVIYFSDSVLHLSDLIPENKTAARLIVLSACETGNGKFYTGEGVYSFNRGFASLGIPASVINLWSVENESTYRLNEYFYKNVSEGMPLDRALQKAKLTFLTGASKQKKLPYYWSSTILVGKTDAVYSSGHFPWLESGIITSLILLAIPVLLKRKYKEPIA